MMPKFIVLSCFVDYFLCLLMPFLCIRILYLSEYLICFRHKQQIFVKFGYEISYHNLSNSKLLVGNLYCLHPSWIWSIKYISSSYNLFWLWAYPMKVILEMRLAHLIRYLLFYNYILKVLLSCICIKLNASSFKNNKSGTADPSRVLLMRSVFFIFVVFCVVLCVCACLRSLSCVQCFLCLWMYIHDCPISFLYNGYLFIQ